MGSGHEPHKEQRDHDASITRRELVLLAVILAAGIAARGFALARSAVEHFDEGVYASNIYAGPPDFAYPDQRFYAPPLLPALIEAGMLAGLAPNLAAILPAFLAGGGTIVAVWWFGRSWFGPQVGLAAASLAALNDFHITFSATALTDALLGLWLVLAVDAIGRSLAGVEQLRRSPAEPAGRTGQAGRLPYGWAIAAGVYTGLAWWTKYNGWLPLAIEAAALPVLWFLLRPPRRELLDWLACFVLTVLVAALMWMPFYISLQSDGGYGPIAANHARYFVGFSGWFSSAARQMTNQFALGHTYAFVGLVLAILLPRLLQPLRAGEVVVQLGKSCFEAVGVLLLTATFLLSVGAAVGIGRQVLAIHREPKLDAQVRRRAIGASLIVVWSGAMVVATPLYTPYPRLALPLVLAASLATAMNWSSAGEKAEGENKLGIGWSCVALLVWIGLGYLLAHLQPHADPHDHPADRRGLVHIAEQVRATDIRREPRVIYVAGEPALFFQLCAVGEPIVAPIPFVPREPATKDGRPISTFIVVGPHANRDLRFQQAWAATQDRWELVAEYDYRPSLVVWLDLNDPRESPQLTTRDRDRVRLYRLRE